MGSANISKEQVLARFDAAAIAAFYRQELGRLDNPRDNGEAKALCPFHDDKNPSLSVNLKTGEYFCHACHAKGDVFAFTQARYSLDFPEAVGKLADFAGVSAMDAPAALPRKDKELPDCPVDWDNPTRVFPYYAADGSHAFDVLRWEKPGYRKTIRQSKGYDKTGQRIRHNKDTELVPYNLVSMAGRPAVLDSEFVVIVEGENKADALISMGICATCNPCGARKWKPEYAEHFKGKGVVILPDNDETGREHGEQVATSLHGVASYVKVLELPGLPLAGDIVDWLEVPGNDKERLQSLMNEAPEWRPEGAETESPFISSEDLFNLAPTEPIVKGLFNRGDLCVLSAAYGQGKSFLALDMGIRISQGETWFGMKTKASPLVYVNLEGHLGNRVKAWRHAHGEYPSFSVFEGKPFDVRDKKFIGNFIKHCPRRAVVVVDTLAIAAGGLNLDRQEDLAHIYGPFRRIAREIDGAVIVVAHLGKDDARGVAGTHQIEAQADALLVIGKGRNIEVKKARDGERKNLGGMSLEVVHLGEDEDGDPVTSCYVVKTFAKIEAKRPSDRLLRILEEFKVLARNVEEDNRAAGQNGPVRVSVERWREHFYRHDTNDKTDSKLKAFNRARADLVDKRLLEVSNDFYYLPDKRTIPDRDRTNTFMSGTNNRTHSRTDTDTTL